MRAWSVAVLLSLGACIRPSTVVGVACTSDADCRAGDATGTCESTGYCSYPDDACAGGQRYSPGAGDGLAGTCVGGSSMCGGKDQPCCGMLCAPDLACDAASMTCVCGGDGQVCCTGDVCSANLACGDTATCECGRVGEPCCGGSTCEMGLSCTSGSCTGGATQVAVGMGHVCVLRPDRTVWCWGNDWKPFPDSTPGLNTTTISSVLPARIVGLTDVDAIRAAEMHTCARKLDGTLWCFGHNESGQLGNGSVLGSSSVPVQVMGLTNVTLFDGGRHHTCAVGNHNGTPGLWCWGRNSRYAHNSNPDMTHGRLGNGGVADSNVPVQVDLSVAAANNQTVRSLSTGNYHSCIALSDNTVWCWGKGTSGQLGQGATTNTTVPVQVNLGGITIPGGATIDEVSCSDGSGFWGNSSCLRLSTNAVYCWGASSDLGDGSTANRSAPTTPVTTSALGSATFSQLAAGQQSRCGLTTLGTVFCWGNNTHGVLGNNDTMTAARPTPVQANVLTGATQLDMSHKTACAIDSQQRVFCWGTNRRGQIPGMAGGRALQPTQVPL